MAWLSDAPRPSEQLRNLLMGKIAWDDAPVSIRSWAQFEIHKAAREVLSLESKGDRRNALGRIPAHIRPRVEAEARRLWALRSP